MDSRPLLRDTKKLQVLIDSTMFDRLLNQNDRLANALLNHWQFSAMEFVRTPAADVHARLLEIPEYQLVTKDDEITSVTIPKLRSCHNFGYKMKDIEEIAKTVCEKEQVSREELDAVVTVFIHRILNRFDSNIYITDKKVLLKKRLWFESHFPGGPLNIMTIDEASVFLDLFLKKNETYSASGWLTLNMGFWYWLSMRLKLPHYNVGDPMIDALAHRVYFALMGLDQIAIQFYSGANNDTMDMMLYHFNYLISLVTGVFDNLALKTNSDLGINFTDLRKVSLSNMSGDDFLREVRDRNPALRGHITSYMNFIMLVYSLRDLVLHREGLGKTGYKNVQEGWQFNFVRIPDESKNYIKFCGDAESDYQPFTKWGLYEGVPGTFLEPYHFSANIVSTLTEFADKFLELLGFPSFVETQKKVQDEFTDTLVQFEQGHVGH